MAVSVGAALQPSMKIPVRVAPARLRGRCFRRASFHPASGVLLPRSPVEQELHACLLAGAVAMHCAPAWEVLGAPSWVLMLLRAVMGD